MRHLKKHLLILLLALTPGAASFAQRAADSLYTFRFVQGQDMFYVPWQGNGAQLEALVALLREYKEEVTSKRIPVQVDGYCTGLTSPEENLRMAAVRSNRVKSELIRRAEVTEASFVTTNHAAEHRGESNVVIVKLRICAEKSSLAADENTDAFEGNTAALEGNTAVSEENTAPSEPTPRHAEPAEASTPSAHTAEETLPAHRNSPVPQGLSLRTNLLYDAFLLPTLGIEWRITPDVGIKLDGSFSYWGGSRGKVQKIWLLNPEARWYLLRHKRFYLGLSGSYGQYNIYKYPLGSLLKDDTGYQGSLWSAGLTVGYSLPLCRRLCLDFNLGLGYTHAGYDSFILMDGERYFKSRDESKSFWGPTQAGISLVWLLGEYK